MRSKWAIPSRKTCPQRQLKRTQDMLHVSYSQSQLSNKYYPCTLNDQLSITQKSPCLFRLNVIVRKQELIAVQEETLSTLKNFLHIYKGWSCFVPDMQSSKGINKTQNLLKLRTFLLRLSAWRGSFSWWLRINLHSLVFICWWCTTWCDG